MLMTAARRRSRKMRLSHLILSLAALSIAAVPPLRAEEPMNAPVYVVTDFEVAPPAASQGTAIARQYAEASRKEDGNLGFEVFEEIARPSRFAMLGSWRDKKASGAHSASGPATAFRDKLKPLLIGGFGVRPYGELAVATPAKAQPPRDALYVLTHVDVFPTFKDQAIELVKAQAEAARKDGGNLRYDVLQWDGHPNHFTLVEIWRDRKAFDASIVTPQNKEFRDKLTPLEGALYDERLYHVVH
jgi:quinol monooxygenase YgiN